MDSFDSGACYLYRFKRPHFFSTVCAWPRLVILAVVLSGLIPVRAAMLSGYARGVAMPVYEERGSNVVATVKVDCLYMESRRMGFFQVRLLPQAVAEKMKVEFLHLPQDPLWWSHFCGQLRLLSRQDAMEVRGFSCWFPQDPWPRLESKRLRLAPGNSAEVACDGLVIRWGTNSCAVAKARLSLEGQSAGWINWRTADQSTISYDLFSRTFKTNLCLPSLTKNNP